MSKVFNNLQKREIILALITRQMLKRNADFIALSALGLIAYFVQAIAWPFGLGRDGLNYLSYFFEMSVSQPVNYLIMVRRTPVAPLIFGSTMSLDGPRLSEAVMAVFFIVSVICVYLMGITIHRKIGLAAALLVCLYPGYGVIFHGVASEPVVAFFFILFWTLFLYTTKTPSIGKFATLAILAVLATLSRPDSIVLVGAAVSPFLLSQFHLRKKILFATTFLGLVLALLLCWETYNYIRYDDFTIARSEKAYIPLMRALLYARIVQPENGQATADLEKLIRDKLLANEPYRSYGIDEKTFFSQATERMFHDLLPLSDMYYGWDSDYEQLRKVGMEAILAHPDKFLISYIKSSFDLFFKNPTLPASQMTTPNSVKAAIGKNGLPIPTEGDLIPRSYIWMNTSTPDMQALPDPNSIELHYLKPEFQERADTLNKKLAEWEKELPSNNGSTRAAGFLNKLTNLFPPPAFWLLMGIIGLIIKPDLSRLFLAGITVICLVMIFYPLLGIGTVLLMRSRFEPFFILFGVTGIAEIIAFSSSRIAKQKLKDM